MAGVQRTVGDVLRSARQMLSLARLGQRDFTEGGERRLPGLFNAITSGRSVTFVVQNLRSRVEDFDDWYAPIQEQLRDDATARWFVEVRNRIEKQGDPGPGTTAVTIDYLDVDRFMQAAPPGATGMFMGDHLGRSGWTIPFPDGTEQTIFFNLPSAVGRADLHLDGGPGGRPIAELLDQWLDRLESIVAGAEDRFGG